MSTDADNLGMAKAKGPKREAVTDQVRRLVRESGLSCYAISGKTGIDESTLSRFLSGKRGLSSNALDRIGALLELEVIAHGPKRS